MGVVWTFLVSSVFSPLSPSLWETARYRLKYCLKGPLNPKQPTNQPTNQIRKILSAAEELRIDHKLRCKDSRRERQMSEKKPNDFPFQRKEGVVVWRDRRWSVMEVGVAADMRI